MKPNQKFKIIISFLAFSFLLSWPLLSLAASLHLNPSQGEFSQGDTFLVEMRINVDGECINAVEANISFPQEDLEAVDFTHGNSIILFWVDPPTIKQESGLIYFSGVIPGGYCGRIPGDPGLSNLVGRIVFRVKGGSEEPVKVIFLENTKVLLNDGLGTPARLSLAGGNFQILSEEADGPKDDWEKEIKEDRIMPEPFTIDIQKDPALFDGQYFITFFTDDKQTGIDRYEIREESSDLIKRGEGWVMGSSPHLLTDQGLGSNIYVKAVDMAGNERVEMVKARYPTRWYEDWIVYAIILLIISFVILWLSRKARPN